MQKRSSGGCSSFLILLFLVFLVLKLAGAVDWSWWWVLSPLWLPAALVLATMVILAVTGVSVYKIVARVFRRPGVGQGTGRGPVGDEGRKDASRPDFLEAEGTEVPVPPTGGQPMQGLPAAPEVPPAADSADPSVSDPGGPSV